MRKLCPDLQPNEFNSGPECWILQTYIRLSRLGLTAQLSNHCVPSAVNICFNSELRNGLRCENCFIIGVRADYPSVKKADLQIVQNKAQIGEDSFWLPLWPQSGILKRSRLGKPHHVRRVAYFGRNVNHYTRILREASGWFKVRQAVLNACNDLQLELVERTSGDWNDFSDIDVAVGIRSFGRRGYDTKPASKLINAWLAGVPFVGGADSAFLQIGSPGFDYLRVTSAEELAMSLERLKSEPDFYNSIVDRGKVMSAPYDHEQIGQLWLGLLKGEVLARYSEWLSVGTSGRRRRLVT